jgi:peptide/nickel transport system substrate-binding protein
MVEMYRLSRRKLFGWTAIGAVGLAGVSLLAARGQQRQGAGPAAPATPAGPPTVALPAGDPRPTVTAQIAVKATVTPAPRIGASLIGTLEGPTVIVDPAQFPTRFNEAPALAALVQQGKLPAVADRIGQDPLVVKPVHEIGRYGGIWRRGFTGPGDKWNGYRAGTGPDHVLFWDYTGEKVVPNIAKAYSFRDDGKTLVITLRRGMKWSDGEPFTADDFVFWFDDIFSNKALLPGGNGTMLINGKPGRIEKGDDLTVRYVFPDPNYLLADMLAGATDLASHSHKGVDFMGSFAPAHYLRNYLPKYVGQDQATRLADEAGYDTWVSLLKFKNNWALNPDLPVVTPWKTTSPIHTPQWVLDRNPYSIWVDTAGNQLPYIDQIQFNQAENLEVLNQRAIAGEYDWQARHVDAGKIPVILENQDTGNYKLRLDPGDYGSDCVIKFNLSYEADPEIATWLKNVDFRRALSLGIDRDQLNETFWFGLGTPGSLVPRESNRYNPGPAYRTLWHRYDVKKANKMLDTVGLAKKDGDGFRVRTDTGERLRLELQTEGGQFPRHTNIAEMIRNQYRDIGIDIVVQENERTLAERRNAANENQLFAWVADGTEHLFTFPTHVFPYNPASGNGALYAQWFHSFGKQGQEPPPKLLEVYRLFRMAFSAPEEERVKAGREIWKIVTDEVFSIGTVGLSPAAMGIRIVNNRLGNVPHRQYNSPDGKTPGISRPVTFFFKS